MPKYVKTNNVACRIIEGQAFIINTKTSTLHELDETGTFIWELIEKNKSAQEIAEKLASTYAVTTEHALKDVIDFIEELDKKGIVNNIFDI